MTTASSSLKYSILFILSVFILSNTSYSQTLPSDRIVDWSLAGYRGVYPIPNMELDITNPSFGGNGNGSLDNSAALQSAITSLNGNPGIIIFPPGNYFFSSSINLSNGIILKGDGSNNTIFTFNLGGSSNLINVEGSNTGITTSFISTAPKGAIEILVQNNNAFTVGDYIRILQDDADLVASSWAVGTVGQIVQITNLTGNNSIMINSDLRMDFDIARNPEIQKIDVVKDVGIECIKLTRQDETNPQHTSSVRFKYAAQSWVRGIESDICNFAHITIDASTNITVDGSYFHHAFDYGGGGRAYGVMIQQTGNECKIENNIFEHLRHSMIVQSGANGNVFAYNYSFDPFWTGTSLPDSSAGDMVCHGNYPFANLFEGNIAQQAIIDASHEKNGPLNTFFRSREELYGIVMTDSFSHQQNFLGNEITNGPHDTLGLYYFLGNDHFFHGNNIRDTIHPQGTNSLPDVSYYTSSQPDFFPIGYNFPPIGIPNAINTGSIPAKDRVDFGGVFTECPPPVTPLPVELTSFSGKTINDENILLQWHIASQNNHDHFRLEKSRDGASFDFLEKIENENDLQSSFSFLDKNPYLGINYYRLVQVDINHTTTFSPVIAIDFQSKSAENNWKIYPTIFSNLLSLETSSQVHNNTFVKIVNIHGKLIFQTQIINNSIQLDLNHLAKGIYFLNIYNDFQISDVRRIVKQ